ncbi:MAG: M14 family metallopeptidase [Pseudomonadota bacterium]
MRLAATACFSADYAEAREKFFAAVRHRRGQLHSYVHPTAYGRKGEALSIDVAILGPVDAANTLLVISGTHGLEGPCGSAAQIGWLLSDHAQKLPENTNVVMIHALNPWGYSHGFRTTENNVDLNRNFIDFDAARPENTHYGDLHAIRTPSAWTPEGLERIDAGLQAFADKMGAQIMIDTISRGQYTHSNGINYGGHAREWSNVTLERIVAEHLTHAQRVGIIDWHTGLGEYGQSFFLCFNDDGSALQKRAAAWWTEEKILGQELFGAGRPNYTGLVFYGVQSFLKDRPLCGAVVEFGTRGFEMAKMLHLDRWLRYEGAPGSSAHDMLRLDLADSFVPFEMLWRQNVLDESLRITQQALAGVGAWTDDATILRSA